MSHSTALHFLTKYPKDLKKHLINMYTNLRRLIIPLLFSFTTVLGGAGRGNRHHFMHHPCTHMSSVLFKDVDFLEASPHYDRPFQGPFEETQLGLAGREVPNSSCWREDAQRWSQKRSRWITMTMGWVFPGPSLRILIFLLFFFYSVSRLILSINMPDKDTHRE